ncbi:MAG TPA: GAF domain-containing protein [Thiotrichaceae bacterium]|nr:GAF domain-containing protein [Thiotrichaceae bacterium]
MLKLSNYLIKEPLYEGIYSLVYRASRQIDNQSVVLKVLKNDYPTSEEIARFKREYEITQKLNESVEGIITVFGLEKEDKTWFMVLEDLGSDSLANHLQVQPFDIAAFLPLAIQMTKIVGEIHRQNVIHKDINPANILWNPNTHQIKVIDFGISSLLSREHTIINNIKSLEGTLAYMSPEQTGRMNRALDYRTDYYALGVTFYQMLTQQLPFEVKDAMELVHCHLAKRPPVAHELNPKIPPVLSKILLKLMAKMAEERYQSALGLKTDLQHCLTQLESTGQMTDFDLGQSDISEQFQIPQKLYGRKSETEKFLSAFERIASIPFSSKETAPECCGRPEMMLVAGYSGIGKSVLVQEIYKPLTQKHGYFISGKFDQFQRNVPYSALVKAFSDLMQQLLTENEAELKHWQAQLLSALGPNGQVIIDIIPEVELIIGPQPQVPALGPSEAQNRFNLVFHGFISVFCHSSHPLILFLDDLQWADSATLKLIELIMTHDQMRYLFIIGAYRDNEVNSTHPFIITLEQLEKAGAIVNQIALTPLTLEQVTQLIADTLHHETQAVHSLAELVTRKTGGNPFFVNQFLKTLYEENLLTFQYPNKASISAFEKGGGKGKRRIWQWDIAQIEALNITDNVVDLMLSKLKKLSEATQQVLRLAACVGNRFDLKILSIINEHSAAETFQELMPAIQEGLVLPLSGLESLTGEVLDTEASQFRFKFLHDRVQQAAYALIDDVHKKTVHLQIGRLLLANTPKTQQADKIFELVDHLNIGYEQVTDEPERLEIAQLNLIAGQKAKAAAAYEAALKYLNIGLRHLTETSWQNQYELTFALYIETMEAKYLSSHFEQSENLAKIALHQAKTRLEQSKVYEIQIQSYITQNQMTAAIETGLHVLEMLEINLEQAPPSHDRIEELINLPILTDPDKLAAMRILMTIVSPAFIANPSLLGPIAFTMVNLSIKQGNSPLAAYAYVFYGLIQCASINIESGYRFGQLALKLLEKLNVTELKSKVYQIFNTFILPWKKQPQESIEPLRESIQAGLETGDLEYACYAAIYYCTYPFLMGEPLEAVEQKYEPYTEMLHQFKYDHAFNYISLWRELVSQLRSKTTDNQLQGQYFNEVETLPLFIETQNSTSLFAFYTAKAILLYFYKDKVGAVKNAKLAVQYVEGGTGMITVAHNFYYSLALLAQSYQAKEEQEALRQVAANQDKMKTWAYHAPMNFQHKYDLVEAEKARVLGQVVETMIFYEQSITGAKNNGYIQEEALAYELAAEFYLKQGMPEFANLYLKNAHYGYQQWGAVAKVKDLEARYPQVLLQATVAKPISSLIITTQHFTPAVSTFESALSVLDLETVMKASQAIAGEVQLDKLLTTLMHILIENAGAEKGLLLLEKDKQWHIVAEEAMETVVKEDNGKTEKDKGNTEIGQVATTLINYVARKKEAVVLHDALNEGHFTQDAYIIAHQPKSILCVPLVNQGKLAGIVYLENKLATGAFTQKRVETVQLLGAQAAISLDNARLYEDLAEYNRTLEAKVVERTHELSEALDHLKATQEELIQSEKMAALGQLVAGIAHEVNTPLGAIRASIGNISDAISESIRQLPLLFQKLSSQQQHDFFALVETTFDSPKNRTAREERKFKRKLIAQLEEDEIDNADEIADTLVDMGIYQLVEPFMSLLKSEDNSFVIQTAYNLSTQYINSQNIMTAVDRASKVVFALKSYARRDIDGHKTQGNVTAGINVVLTLYQNQLKQGVEVITDYQKVPEIRCYPDELNQVWTNLIHNAIQAMDNQGTLEITVTQQDNHLVIQITDSGKGIEENIRSRIFEPFFTTKPAGEGSGLGLDIVRKIIEKHQGKIEVASRPGKTTFSVFLPIL